MRQDGAIHERSECITSDSELFASDHRGNERMIGGETQDFASGKSHVPFPALKADNKFYKGGGEKYA